MNVKSRDYSDFEVTYMKNIKKIFLLNVEIVSKVGILYVKNSYIWRKYLYKNYKIITYLYDELDMFVYINIRNE